MRRSTAWSFRSASTLRGCRSRNATHCTRSSASRLPSPLNDSSSASLHSRCLPRSRVEAPLLCVIDDAHWIDRESLDALSFVARRLFADRVVPIFAARRTEAPLPFDGLTTLSVDGLDDDAALRLLAESASTPVDRAVAERIVAETGGCPARAAGARLRIECGAARRRARPPRSPADHRTARDALHASSTRVAGRDAAAPADRRRGSFRRSRARRVRRRVLDVSVTAMEPAEQQQMITFRPGIEFRHPLIRAAA